jgi:hypothetical protein
MVLIFSALVQFGFVFERQIGIENAIRDGARRAATYATTTNAQAVTNAPLMWDVVFNSSTGLLAKNIQGFDNSALCQDSVTYTDQTDASGNTSVRVRVAATYKHPLFMPLITQIIDAIDSRTDNALAITTSSEFTVQQNTTASATVGGTYTFPSGGAVVTC